MINREIGSPASASEDAEIEALCKRFEGRYRAYFLEHPESHWVAFSMDTEELIAGGLDCDEYPDDETCERLKFICGQDIHIFGKPTPVEPLDK